MHIEPGNKASRGGPGLRPEAGREMARRTRTQQRWAAQSKQRLYQLCAGPAGQGRRACLSWGMPATPAAPRPAKDMILRGLLCALIGAAVLLSPPYIASPGMRAAIAGSWLVGWFAVVLGGVLVAKGALRLRSGKN